MASNKIKITDKAILATETSRNIIENAQGVVSDAVDALRDAVVRQIKREVEEATGRKIIRKGRPDAVTAKHVRKVVLDAVQRTLVVKVGA